MMQTWLYGERFDSIALHHVLSKGRHLRVVEFWRDVRFLHDQRVVFPSDDASFPVNLYTFQAAPDPLVGRPKLWFITPVEAVNEFDAIRKGRATVSYAAAALGLATRLPFQPTGDFRVAQAATTEHGFIADFEGDNLSSFTVLLESPGAEGDEVAARQSKPFHQPVIGAVTNEKYLQIVFSDVMRQADRDTNVDVGDLRISSEDAVAVVAGGSMNVGNELALRVAEIYSDALRQRDPRSQFLVLWSAIELLTNTSGH